MQKNGVFSMVWATLSIILILTLLLPASVTYAAPNEQAGKVDLDANQIVFSIKRTNGTIWQFKNLKIEGENQRGEYLLWNTPKE